MKVLKYLKWNSSEKLSLCPTVTKFPAIVEVYTDADWAGDKEDRKSTSGMALLINGVMISWKCKKQTSVALSTAEAEYVAMVEGIKEALGASECLREIGIMVQSPIIVKSDNQAAIAQVKNESTSSKAKHVDIKYKFVQDLSRKGLIKIEYVDTEEQMADLFTKPFNFIKFRELKLLVGLKSQH
jgi:ribonuclease HI